MNTHAATCDRCHETVKPGEGLVLGKYPDGSWMVIHRDCIPVSRRNSVTDYVAQLAEMMETEGFRILGKDLSDPAICEEIVKIRKHLGDPVENLLSRIGGQLFMKQDSASCLENRVRVHNMEPVKLSRQEEHRLRSLREDIALLTECRDMIETLRAENNQ